MRMKKIFLILFIVGLVLIAAIVIKLSNDDANIEHGNERINQDKESQINLKLEKEKDKVIEETLAQMRKENKRDRAEGVEIAMKDNSMKKVDFSEEEIGLALECAERYLSNKYNDRDYNKDWHMGGCIDPRINQIYEDVDKGVCEGYDSKNIFIIEFEKEKDIYEYLFLVRNSVDSNWKVIYEGDFYKSKKS